MSIIFWLCLYSLTLYWSYAYKAVPLQSQIFAAMLFVVSPYWHPLSLAGRGDGYKVTSSESYLHNYIYHIINNCYSAVCSYYVQMIVYCFHMVCKYTYLIGTTISYRETSRIVFTAQVVEHSFQLEHLLTRICCRKEKIFPPKITHLQ